MWPARRRSAERLIGRNARLAAGAGAALAIALSALLTGDLMIPQPKVFDPEASLAAWDRVVTVLQHPRCLNCHQPNEPLQGDNQRPHSPRVVRGRDNMGAPGMRCGSCHSEHSNNEASLVPGASDWKMPPRSRAWGGMTPGQICRALKDPSKNGRRTSKGIVKHMQDDSLVHWSWDPGGARESISMPHHVFVEFVEEWLQNGAYCPD